MKQERVCDFIRYQCLNTPIEGLSQLMLSQTFTFAETLVWNTSTFLCTMLWCVLIWASHVFMNTYNRCYVKQNRCSLNQDDQTQQLWNKKRVCAFVRYQCSDTPIEGLIQLMLNQTAWIKIALSFFILVLFCLSLKYCLIIIFLYIFDNNKIKLLLKYERGGVG